MYFINLVSNKNKVLNNSLINVIYIYSVIYFSKKKNIYI